MTKLPCRLDALQLLNVRLDTRAAKVACQDQTADRRPWPRPVRRQKGRHRVKRVTAHQHRWGEDLGHSIGPRVTALRDRAYGAIGTRQPGPD